MTTKGQQVGKYVRGLAAPVLLWMLVAYLLAQLLPSWLRGDEEYDEKALREWIDEARVFRGESLPDIVRDYLEQVERARQVNPASGPGNDLALELRAERIEEYLKVLGTPPTKLYPSQLPLFPIIYRLEVNFDEDLDLPPIAWDSELPRHPSQYRELLGHRLHDRATVSVQYQLHAYNKRYHLEQAARARLRWLSALAIVGTVLALSWVYLVQHRERERERQRAEAQRQIDQAERLLLQEELRRQEAERRHEETERKLLEQRLATQAAEGKALELKSQLYASISIMAGSYAHNIKNLLVRPNDLLRRCLEADSLSPQQEQMLHEVRQTLGTVTERLQQILRTVRRDPTRSELTRIDLNEIARDIERTWKELAREKWKLVIGLETAPEPLWIEGDPSHLQQAVENLLFNARDATFEMRNHRREQAHRAAGLNELERRQALIAAAAWKGEVWLRTYRRGDRAVLEVRDNGIGMTAEVCRRCTETHFSTKRDNAIYEGHSTGMGLGLSFVTVILEHHRAVLEIESEPLQGATFRASFPLAS
ncbi:MAG TPA: HAMP domain-containing sensor histidine kinase [Gemmataceae bacterium]|nr:HAMP domain-containing sensor histidine kinase [Gemmataceae bacterium]